MDGAVDMIMTFDTAYVATVGASVVYFGMAGIMGSGGEEAGGVSSMVRRYRLRQR